MANHGFGGLSGALAFTVFTATFLCSACKTTSPSRPTAAPPVRAQGPLVVAPTCIDFTIDVYFEPGSAALGPVAEDLLDAAAKRARRCSITGVRVRGLADSAGGHEANMELSRTRADSVTRALHRRGFNQVQFQVTAAGDQGAAAPSRGASHPLRRRVEVEIDLATP